MNKMVLGFIALIVVVGGVYAYTTKNQEVAMMEQKASEEKMMLEKKAMEEKNGAVMEQKDGAAMMEKKDTAMMKGSYQVYSPEKVALAEQGKVILFFKASWCPTCRALDADIKKNLSAIPDGVTILEVDYDNSTELKQKYGVTMQHTLVQVDAKGNQLAKWSGGNTLEAVVKNIK